MSRSSAAQPPTRRRLAAGVDGGGVTVRERRLGDLSIRLREDRPRPLVSVAGELDLASVGLLTAMLDHVRRNLRRRPGAVSALDDDDVDVDLSAVTFADSHGLAPVLDGRTRIVAASTSVRRVLLILPGATRPPPWPGRPPSDAHGMV